MLGFKKKCREQREEEESEDFSHDFPLRPPPPFCSLSIVITMMMIRLKLSASVRLIPSFFATSPQKSSCLDNGEMTRTVIGGAFFQARDSKRTEFQRREGSLGFWTPPDKG